MSKNKSAYPALFEPITVNKMTLKNRIVMEPMCSNIPTVTGEIGEDGISYYEQRAKGGTGLIIVENACIDYPMGGNGTVQLRIDDIGYVPGLYKLTERLHRYGAKVSIQINHAGSGANPARTGCQPASASDIPNHVGGIVPRPLTEEEIYGIVDKYGAAAVRVKQAGFDAIEIHAGHTFLLNQFLSPIFNKRTDKFGGSYENRARFARLVIDKVREAVGPDFPISLRVSAEEFLPGGNTLEDTLELLTYLNDGIDMFNISAALIDSSYYQIDKMDLVDGWLAYTAEAVKKKFGKPTITVGNIRDPKIAEEIITSGQADLIGMGRGLIAEPNWAKKVENGKEALLRKCISCNLCADNRLGGKNLPIRCSINPDIYYEDSYKSNKTGKAEKVVVVGGGTAGLEAACTAAEIGCETILIEEKEYVGGLAREVSKLPAKRRMGDFPDYLKNRAALLDNLEIMTGTKADVALVESFSPDYVINATGSSPLLPPIEGLKENIDKDGGKGYSIFGLLDRIDKFNDLDVEDKKIVVIGGGAVGLDVVEYFAQKKADCTIVEMMNATGRDLDSVAKVAFRDLLKEHNVDVKTNTKLTKVMPDQVEVEENGVKSTLTFDYLFVCLGMAPKNKTYQELCEHFKDSDVKVINIGDSMAAGKIVNGTKAGREIIYDILG